MSLYSLIAFVKYKLKAKRLHGVHSPFAYNFSEEVLYSNKHNGQPATLDTQAKYNLLVSRIEKCYQLRPPMPISLADADVTNNNLLVVTDDNAGHWLQIVNKHVNNMMPGTFIIIPGIHKDKRRATKWNRITHHPKIPMSIDLYGLGILVIKSEFKEKQHFILKN